MKTDQTNEQPATGHQVAAVVRPLTEPQKTALAGKQFRMQMAMDCKDGGIIVCRCEALGLNKQVFTPRRKNGHSEPQQVTYFFNNDDREFECLADAIDALVADGKLSV